MTPTSNHVAFNIWSACRYYLGFTESPVYTDWLWTCANVNTTGGPVDVGKSLELAGRPGGLGIDVPRWAEVEVPGARTFDIQAAIVVSSAYIHVLCPVLLRIDIYFALSQ